MKRLFILLLLGLLTVSRAWPLHGANAAEQRVMVYFFWSTGCPHCEKERVFLEKLRGRDERLDIRSFEVKGNRDNALLMTKMAGAHGIKLAGVPATFVGDHDPLIGYLGDDLTGREIEERIQACWGRGCPDPAAILDRPPPSPAVPLFSSGQETAGTCPEDAECPEEEQGRSPAAGGAPHGMPAGSGDTVLRLPLLGEVHSMRTSLTLQTIMIAVLDSFNPCAFFVLFTLLGLLIHARSRARLLLIGGIFVFFSGFIYFLFMAAWLNVFLAAGGIAVFTVIAGMVALVIATINIKDYFFYKKGISLTIPERAKPGLFERMRRLLKATSVISAAGGTVVLAAAANMYELFCTAGFPMVYTRILTLHRLTTAAYYLYLVLYNIVYVIPLALIVLVFAATLGKKKLTEGQGRILKLVSGMMMLSLGCVLLVRPELLNNIIITAALLTFSFAVSAGIVLIERVRMRMTGR